eukprot:Em0011g1193a
MSASTVCTTVNTGEKPDESGDASVMAGSDVQTHSRGLCDTETEGDGVDEVVVMCVVWGGWKIGLSFYSVDTGFLHTMSDVAEAEDFGLTSEATPTHVPTPFHAIPSPRDQLVVWMKTPTCMELHVCHSHLTTPTSRLTTSTSCLTTPTSSPHHSHLLASPLPPPASPLPTSCLTTPTSSPHHSHLTTPTSASPLPTSSPHHSHLTTPTSPLPPHHSHLLPHHSHLLPHHSHLLASPLPPPASPLPPPASPLPPPRLTTPTLTTPTSCLTTPTSCLTTPTSPLPPPRLTKHTCSSSALQIFQKETHPSVYKGGGGSKEGLSLFGLTMICSMAQPTSRHHEQDQISVGLKNVARPLRDIPTLQQRLDAVSFLAAPKNTEVATNIQDCLKHIRNLPTIYNAIFIGDMCRALSQDISIFKRIAAAFTDELPRVASLINQIIDFGESSLHNRFVVKPNIDSELDEKKQLYNGLPDLMTQVAEEELAKLPDYITQCTIIYVPQLGFLLSIPRALICWRRKTLYCLAWSSCSYQTHGHYKTDRTKELDAQLGDTQCEITDRETIIMHRLQAVILEHTNILLDTVELAAELDCLLALAVFAREHNCVRPELQEEPGIYIKAGRHPLQELCVTAFVPNDAHIDLKHGRMKVLTGPNASGKSVYLKQVGLLVFMAHLGSFVPADGALIGMVDHIFTRIRTRETVSVALSTFMIDLNQVDGLALLTASLRHWLAKGSMCPSVLVSTHFHGLVKQKLLPDNECVEYLTMDTLRDGDELVFLYQLVPGLSDISYACHIAAGVGLPTNIVQRAAEVSELIRANKLVGKIGGPGLKRQKEVYV